MEYNKIDKNKLESEFHDIESKSLWPKIFQQIREESLKKEYSSEEAKKGDNKFLNRYRDVNPYDHSRVILSKPGFSYINASFITVEEARRKYILTQGPLQNTIPHFWLMVWEQNSHAIIMLNKLIEKNQSKCSQYWPVSIVEDNNKMELLDVDLKVELLSEIDYSHYIIRNIRLTNLTSEEFRDVIQFHYTAWPDFGVPQSPLTFLKFLRDIRQSGAFNSDVGPPIVHCSAGIGRSGTFCLVDSCLVTMNEKEIDRVSVRDVILEMRTYRMGLIQTPDQLRFSYIAIMQGLKVDWSSCNSEGLPYDESLHLKNGDTNSSLPDDRNSNSSDSEDDAPPPLPPPRFHPEKPLPGLPNDLSSELESNVDECSDSTDLDDEETKLFENTSSDEIIVSDNDKKTINEPLTSGVLVTRKRKHSDNEEKSKHTSKKVEETLKKQTDAEKWKKKKSPLINLSLKVEEMKKKQMDAEKWKKKRSLLINLTLGISSFLAISGTVMAFFLFRKS